MSDEEFIRRLNTAASAGGRGVDLSKMTDDEIREHLLGRHASAIEAQRAGTTKIGPVADESAAAKPGRTRSITMTTAQPGQEQRMVTDEMIEAGYRAFVARKPIASTDAERLACEAIYTAMHSARPTADLGEDGELEGKLWSYAHDLKLSVPLRQAVEEARDRLILYREALKVMVDAWEALPGPRHYSDDDIQRWVSGKLKPAVDNIRAVLSRSGDD